MRVLHITGIPETCNMEDISGLVDGLNIDSVFIELEKGEDFKFKGTVFMKPSTRKQSESLLNEQNLTCNGETLKIIERKDFLQTRRERKGDRKSENDDKDADKNEQRESRRSERPKFQLERKECAVLHFTGASENTHFQEIKTVFSNFEDVAWVDYINGEEEGYVRFMEDGAAQRAIDAIKGENDGKVIVDDLEFEVRILEGNEDEEYWKKTEDLIESKRRRNYFRLQKRRGGYGGGRRYRRRPWGRNRREGDEEQEEKDNRSVDEKPTEASVTTE